MNLECIKISLDRYPQHYSAGISIITNCFCTDSLSKEYLHKEELAVYNTYNNKHRKKNYLLGRLSAKKAIMQLIAVSEPKSIWIDSGVFQFPVVRGSFLENIQVSISHCDGIGFSIAFPEAHPIGVDVEKLDSSNYQALQTQMTKKEKKLLRDIDAGVNYSTAIFSIKEALSKILKTGMMLDFKLLEVEQVTIHEKNILACSFTHFQQYKAFAFIRQEYAFAITLPKRTTLIVDSISELLNTLSI